MPCSSERQRARKFQQGYVYKISFFPAVAHFERYLNRFWQVEQENIILISLGQLLELLKNILKSYFINVIHSEEEDRWERTGLVYHN